MFFARAGPRPSIPVRFAIPMEKQVLSPPTVASVKYDRNFIKTAVCELRFPTLLELETKPPTAFQAKVRKSYPFFEKQVVEQVGAEAMTREQHYLFRSKDKNWTVVVKSSSLALETSKYIDFQDFLDRFTEVMNYARAMIDSDFFTRVGLRYMNAIPMQGGNPEGWIRPELIRPIAGGVLGATKVSRALVQGFLENGEYSMRHGFVTGEAGKGEPPSYTLDFDYFKEGVEFGEVIPLLKQFNETNFSLFIWCLDDKAKKVLGEGKAK